MILKNSIKLSSSQGLTSAKHLYGIQSRHIQKFLFKIKSGQCNLILMKERKLTYIIPILKSLHWPSISPLIEYKFYLLVHQSIHENVPHWKNCSKVSFQTGPFALWIPTDSIHHDQNCAPWGIGPFALLHLFCRMPSLIIWGHPRLQKDLKIGLKTF